MSPNGHAPYPKPPPDRHGSWTVRVWCELYGFDNPFTSLVSDKRGFCTGYFCALREQPQAQRAFWTLLCAPDGTVKEHLPPTPPKVRDPKGDPIAWLAGDQVTVRLMFGGVYREATEPACVFGVQSALSRAAQACFVQELQANPPDIGETLKELYKLSEGAFDNVNVQEFCDEVRGRGEDG